MLVDNDLVVVGGRDYAVETPSVIAVPVNLMAALCPPVSQGHFAVRGTRLARNTWFPAARLCCGRGEPRFFRGSSVEALNTNSKSKIDFGRN